MFAGDGLMVSLVLFVVYCLLWLVWVAVVRWLGSDFGPVCVRCSVCFLVLVLLC